MTLVSLITLDIQSNIRLFADSLNSIVDNPAISADILISDFETVMTWSNKWLVTFNPSKTKSLPLPRKSNYTLTHFRSESPYISGNLSLIRLLLEISNRKISNANHDQEYL